MIRLPLGSHGTDLLSELIIFLLIYAIISLFMLTESGHSSRSPVEILKSDFIVNLPLVTHTLKERTKRSGPLQTLSELTEEMNISLSIKGDVKGWDQEGKGVLFVGDHMNSWDCILLLAIVNNLGRQDLLLITKPYSRTNHVLAAMGDGESELTAPFIPKSMTQTGTASGLMERHIRRKFREVLPTTEEAAEINEETLVRSTRQLEEGHMVNIFPGGKVSNGNAVWRKGVGSIIQSLSDSGRDNTLIVRYQFDNAHAKRTLLALYLTTFGKTPPRQDIVMHLKKQATVSEIFPEKLLELTPAEITGLLRERTQPK